MDDLREKVAETGHDLNDWTEASAEYYRLKAFKFSMQGLLFLVKGMLLGILALLCLVFTSVAGAFALGVALGSDAWGFLAVGGAYLLVLTLAYRYRSALNRPILKRFSEYYFEE